MKTLKQYYRIERKNISFLRFVFEACEGIAGITTVDPEQGIIMLCIAPGCELDVQTVLDGMNIRIETILPDKE